MTDACTAGTDADPPLSLRERKYGRKLGRPRNPNLERQFKPTVEQRALVRLLAGFLIPHDRIVQAIRNPRTRRAINVSTLLRHFEHELAAGRAEVDSLIAEGLTKKLREGHMTALIWCSKNLWNWTDKVEQQSHNTVDMSVQVQRSREDLEQALRAHGLHSIAEKGLFGYDKPLLDEKPHLAHEYHLEHGDLG
jgi:hypothetical protein